MFLLGWFGALKRATFNMFDIGCDRSFGVVSNFQNGGGYVWGRHLYNLCIYGHVKQCGNAVDFCIIIQNFKSCARIDATFWHLIAHRPKLSLFFFIIARNVTQRSRLLNGIELIICLSRLMICQNKIDRTRIRSIFTFFKFSFIQLN